MTLVTSIQIVILSRPPLRPGRQQPEAPSFRHLHALAFEVEGCKEPASAVNIIVSFVVAVYFTRRVILAGNEELEVSEELSKLVTKYMQLTSNTKNSKKARASKRCNEEISRITPNSIIIYTDGSSYGNPGPSGAGAFICVPKKGESYLYQVLGEGTNNNGELWAIGMALCYLREEGVPSSPIFIVTDSQLAIDLISAGSRPKSSAIRETADQVISLIRNYPNRVRLIHSPGHADVRGNIIADALANTGSVRSRSKDLPAVKLRGTRFTYREIGIPPTIYPN